MNTQHQHPTAPTLHFDPTAMEIGYDLPHARTIQTVTDEHGMRISHVRLRNGEYAMLNAFDLTRLMAAGMAASGWFVGIGPSGHAAVVAPSRSPRLPVILVARAILGCTPGEYVRFGRPGDPLSYLDLRRSNIAIEQRAVQAFPIVTLADLERGSS
ncbi:hypothetical protein QTH90_06260 [Variovorax sp. J2P1-59]|uniref:hypothetical protein n=1 Tax=Variovorax flavidus TaxID=3053501 RepID=UPI0025789EB6|nr:hypothetical protein [Variovorax sp. J2P1-59]MDM0073977.1 hypothetical protein [Variovorax sp. J2P1-59]